MRFFLNIERYRVRDAAVQELPGLRNGMPLDQDMYDATLWSSIAPLSEWSVSNRSNPADIHDFTCGAYRTNPSVDISLARGGNTGVRETNLSPEKQLNVH